MSFSEREIAIVDLLDAGLTTAQVADALGVGRSTVNVYIKKIVDKLPPAHGPPVRRIVAWSARQKATR